MRLLIVEDETDLAQVLADGLRHEGFIVDVAGDGATALATLGTTDIDVVVLDRDLPGVHGDEICAALVESGALTRVLMLTASGSVAERVEGLQLGADDYLPKPFAFDELVARVQALGRRATPAAPPNGSRCAPIGPSRFRIAPCSARMFRSGWLAASRP